MKRFFFVFTMLLIVFLALTAGALVAVQYGAIGANTAQPLFVGGWGITLIDYYGPAIIFPRGDVMVIRQSSLADVGPGSAVLARVEGAAILSGHVEAKTDGGFTFASPGRDTVDLPAAGLLGYYRFRLPHVADILASLRSTPVVVTLGGVLFVSILLWRLLPGRRNDGGGLSPSDEEIASILD